jgi:hypothetical protein
MGGVEVTEQQSRTTAFIWLGRRHRELMPAPGQDFFDAGVGFSGTFLGLETAFPYVNNIPSLRSQFPDVAGVARSVHLDFLPPKLAVRFRNMAN